MTKPIATKLLSLLALSFFLSGTLSAADGLEFHDDFDKALTEAKETGKPVITIFSASWCGPCKKMKSQVYPSAEVTPFHNYFVWAYLDADQAKNRGLMKQFGVNGIPHISFVSPEGEEIEKSVGYVAPPKFATQLAEVVQKYKPGTPLPPATAAPEKKKGLFGKIFKKNQ